MLTPVAAMQGEDEEDTRLLKEFETWARNYITSFRWCLPITEMYFAHGIGGIFAIFLFEFEGKIAGIADMLWVVVGDLPPVYMVTDACKCARDVLEAYCELMDDWVAAVREGGDFDEVYPVSAPRTAENADALEDRLGWIRREFIPEAPTDPLIGENGVIKSNGSRR
jgi:hypothetical protein